MRYSRKISKLKSQHLRNKEFSIVDRLSLLDDKIVSEKISAAEFDEYSRLKQNIENIEGIKWEGPRIRSRIEQIEFNEKSFQKFFLNYIMIQKLCAFVFAAYWN